ncbi:MAG: hypothetical protein AAGE52_34125 [Myxococcota bacterium]
MRLTSIFDRSNELILLTILLLGFGFCSEAEAQRGAPLDGEEIGAWDHFELSMGFVGGTRRYGELTYNRSAQYEEWLDEGPFENVSALGLRYDLRLVVSYVRMTVGVDIPFASFDSSQTVMMLDGNETALTKIRGWDLRFGIGAEYPFGAVAPFLDLIGDVAFAKATFVTGTRDDTISGRGFGFALRGGIRLHLRKWFFAAASAELGLVGSTRWGAELSVGFAIM